ncbi:Methionyl-tRNA formyltransferase [Candidatus Westeberhardia cardiocondylae]|uniref:Methionyl-tRNA formyltransferase n=1 Tax=Candidatus Westeberhardia cardiocondylae TaxID=1594731 RepID=A0A0H5BWM3_9ENTR|nr:methionyl-tRNA formyltransferase [Candidatus Westeberhardia cardiocondylae]MCR3756395.1 10-formyltetrahydrofolate:L-methionyl-tRNA(fMet) N-formyltransferase [Candidatus Westeberhardia cardiocondylae]CEN32004.1 Methionyl-tRNA formyltransferase [Candidatus Westeberhardia cardiocondylae]
MYKILRIIFAGTPQFSANHLNTLLTKSKHNIVGIFTKPNHSLSRTKTSKNNNVKKLSKKYNINLFQPHSFHKTKKWEKIIKTLNADIMVVVSYGLIIPKKILTIPKFGCINIHASLLPKWRGAAPIQRAILAGDKQTGITIIQMNSKLDQGDILYKKFCNIKYNETTESLYLKLSNIGSTALLKVLEKISNNKIKPTPQNHDLSTYAKKIQKSETKINWNLPAYKLDRYIRAFNPWPISYFLINEKRIKIWEATIDKKISLKKPGTITHINKQGIHVSTGHETLILVRLQTENKKPTHFSDMMNSKKNKWIFIGNILQ